MRSFFPELWLVTLSGLAGCSDALIRMDAGAGVDAGPTDAGLDGGARDAGSPDAAPGDASGGDAAARVRIVAANLTSGGQSYTAGHGLRILEALEADVVLVQEMNFQDNSEAAFETFTQRVCDTDCTAVRGSGTQIPNGLVSRYPIVSSGVWEDPETDTREFAWARIDIPGDTDLWAVSVHLLANSGGAARQLEAEALMAAIAGQVPMTDHLAIGGDFNVSGGAVFDALSARVDVTSRPADQAGNSNTNSPRNRRIDGVHVSPTLDAFEVAVRIGDQSFRGGLVVDTRVFTPIEDLAPANASDSDAQGMQHMAVVRDFELPP